MVVWRIWKHWNHKIKIIKTYLESKKFKSKYLFNSSSKAYLMLLESINYIKTHRNYMEWKQAQRYSCVQNKAQRSIIKIIPTKFKMLQYKLDSPQTNFSYKFPHELSSDLRLTWNLEKMFFISLQKSFLFYRKSKEKDLSKNSTKT